MSANDAWVKRQAAWFDESSNPSHAWTNDSLRIALLAAAGMSLPLGAPVQLGVRVDGTTSAAPSPEAAGAIARLRELARVRGSAWPTKSVVGSAGAHAVYLLAQSDTGLGRVALRRMMEAGPDESSAADVATLEDQLRLAAGRKQLYGTHFVVDANGQLRIRPLEDSAHADLRREDAGLPPLAVTVCLARASRVDPARTLRRD